MIFTRPILLRLRCSQPVLNEDAKHNQELMLMSMSLQHLPEVEQAHQDEWNASGIPQSIIDRNFQTIIDPREVDELLNRNTDKDKRWKHSEALTPGWAVTGVDPRTGERWHNGAQYKPNEPIQDPKTGKSRKYLSPSKQSLAPLFLEVDDHAYWPKLIENIHHPIILTEGAKKAGAVLGQDLPCISLPGVATGAKLGKLRKELKLFAQYGRKFYLAFDRDILTKPSVVRALHNLGRQLAAEGATVHILEWDDSHKGIDDWIAAGGIVGEAIEAARTIEEWRKTAFDKDGSIDGDDCKLLKRFKRVETVLGDRMEWNVLTRKVEIDATPVDEEALRVFLAKRFNLDIPKSDCGPVCMDIAMQRPHDPIKNYLEECAETYGSDSGLLDAIAPTYLGATNPLHIMFIRKTLIAAVARIFEPGCKVDTVLILQGKQGAKKSTFFETLASYEWFEDGMGTSSDKDELLKMYDVWWCEWAELETVFKRKDVSALKAFITTKIDRLRAPYGKGNITLPRRSILVGSTNESSFLADPTGSRRFWVVPVNLPGNQKIDIESIALQRDRIWAAAVHAYRAKEEWWLSAELEQDAQVANKDYQDSDTWEDVIAEWVDCRTKFTLDHLLKECFDIEIKEQSRGVQRRAGKVLKQMGYINKALRIDGNPQKRYWLRKEKWCESCKKIIHEGFICHRCHTHKIEDKNSIREGNSACDIIRDISVTYDEKSALYVTDYEKKPECDISDTPRDISVTYEVSRVQPPDSNGFSSCDISDISPPLESFKNKKSFSPLPLFQVGDVVEILTGQQSTKQATITAIDGEKITVTRERWAVTRDYGSDDLRFIRRPNVQN